MTLYAVAYHGARVGTFLRGLSIAEYVASRESVSETVYLTMVGVFAIMPLVVARR